MKSFIWVYFSFFRFVVPALFFGTTSFLAFSEVSWCAYCFPCFGPSHPPSRRQRKPLFQADKAALVYPSIIELWFIVVYIRCYLFFSFSSPIWFLQPHVLLNLSFLESVSSLIKGETSFNHSSSHEHNLSLPWNRPLSFFLLLDCRIPTPKK